MGQVWLRVGAGYTNLTVGLALASLCVSHGAIAMLEMLNSRGINLRTLYGGLTLMHIAAREMQAVSVIWLVENGYEDLVLQRTPDGTTPLHEAIKAGDAFIMNYLLNQLAKIEEGPFQGGRVGNHVARSAHERRTTAEQVAVARGLRGRKMKEKTKRKRG